jgi:hypothetical protein
MPSSSLGPFGSELSSSPALSRLRGTSTSVARCQYPVRHFLSRFQQSLPFGAFTPPDQCTLPEPDRKTYLGGPPDFPSLPESRSFLISSNSGSPFRARYFPLGSLFLEPLGTILMMLLGRNLVNEKMNAWQGFAEVLFHLESVVYEWHSVDIVWIKQQSEDLFREKLSARA